MSAAVRGSSGGRTRQGGGRARGKGDGRALGAPRFARVRAGAEGTPLQVDGRPIEAVRESWLIEDRWWTGRPLRRRYWEVLSASGRNLVVFHDLCTGEWFAQGG
ncbi:MAG TPA: hypothetical protein VGI76_03150 [Solirubrobacteraceae bacterium]|jgi:hypothetical protein